MASKGIPPTVGNFILLLTSKLTQYDERTSARESKRGRTNIYRLGHLLKAAQKVEDEVLGHRNMTEDPYMTPFYAEQMVGSMARHFTVNPISNEFDLAPCRNVVKQLEAFLASGKNPSLVE